MPRSVSEFNLSGVGDMALPASHRSPMSHTHATSTIIFPMQQPQQQTQKPREKMVTFEDESKCPHGLPTTPSRKGQILDDVFM